MNSQQLHAILQEIGNHLECKKCQDKFNIKDLVLVNQNSNTATFEIKCQKCGTMMQIAAEIGGQSSTNKAQLQLQDTIISKTEINSLHKVLTSISSFKDMFSSMIIILCIVLFGGCTTKEDILNKIDESKSIGAQLINEGKSTYSGAIQTINDTPAKIEGAINDVKNLKKETEKTIKDTQDAMKKVGEATTAIKEASDALTKIGK